MVSVPSAGLGGGPPCIWPCGARLVATTVVRRAVILYAFWRVSVSPARSAPTGCVFSCVYIRFFKQTFRGSRPVGALLLQGTAAMG